TVVFVAAAGGVRISGGGVGGGRIVVSGSPYVDRRQVADNLFTDARLTELEKTVAAQDGRQLAAVGLRVNEDRFLRQPGLRHLNDVVEDRRRVARCDAGFHRSFFSRVARGGGRPGGFRRGLRRRRARLLSCRPRQHLADNGLRDSLFFQPRRVFRRQGEAG